MSEADEISDKRKALGWSQARLADEARAIMPTPDPKLVQQTITRIEGGAHSKYKVYVLQALGLSVGGASPRLAPSVLPPTDVEYLPNAPSFRSLLGPRDVPERGIAVGGEDGDFEMNGEDELGFLPRPPGLVGRTVFAIRVKSDSMKPKYEEGDVVFVEEKREPRAGEIAVVELKQTEEGRPGRAFIKKLVSKSGGVVIVEQFNPERQYPYPRDSVRALYRVVPYNELLGV